jgi:hypothetical protein
LNHSARDTFCAGKVSRPSGTQLCLPTLPGTSVPGFHIPPLRGWSCGGYSALRSSWAGERQIWGEHSLLGRWWRLGVQGSFDFAQEDRANCNAELIAASAPTLQFAMGTEYGALVETRAEAGCSICRANLHPSTRSGQAFSQRTREMGYPRHCFGNFNSHFWGDL